MAEAGTHAPEAGQPSPSRFTALELAVAEHLIHLSESSSSSAAVFGPASVASAASSSSSPRSVNAPAVPRGGGLAALAAAEEDEQEVGGRPRRNSRYRPIAEIYASTEPKLEPKPIGARGGGRKDRPKQAAVPGRRRGSREKVCGGTCL